MGEDKAEFLFPCLLLAVLVVGFWACPREEWEALKCVLIWLLLADRAFPLLCRIWQWLAKTFVRKEE